MAYSLNLWVMMRLYYIENENYFIIHICIASWKDLPQNRLLVIIFGILQTFWDVLEALWVNIVINHISTLCFLFSTFSFRYVSQGINLFLQSIIFWWNTTLASSQVSRKKHLRTLEKKKPILERKKRRKGEKMIISYVVHRDKGQKP